MGKKYYTDNETNGNIYICDEDEEVGRKIGEFDGKGNPLIN